MNGIRASGRWYRLPGSILAVLAFCACSSGSGDDTGVPDLLPDVPAEVPVDGIEAGPSDAPADAPAPADLADLAPADTPAEIPDAPPHDAVADADSDGSDLAPADVPDVPPPPAPHPLFDFLGGVWLIEYPNPDYPSSTIDVRADDKAVPLRHDLAGTEGACQLWVAQATYPQCTPDCGFDSYCSDTNVCVPMSKHIGMGSVTIEAKGGPYDFVPDESYWYTGPSSLPANLFDPSMTVRVTAAGDTVPAFQQSLPGIGDLVLDLASGMVTLTDNQDTELRWAPANDGSTIEVVLQTGWHGRPPDTILWCSAPDAAGKVVVAKALSAGVGIMDPDQPSLFQHPSYVRRVRRAVVDTDRGPYEVSLSSQVGVGLKHLGK